MEISAVVHQVVGAETLIGLHLQFRIPVPIGGEIRAAVIHDDNLEILPLRNGCQSSPKQFRDAVMRDDY